MSREQLDRARELIIEGRLDDARDILAPLAEISTTAQKWLANLNDLAADADEPETESPAVDDNMLPVPPEPDLTIEDDDVFAPEATADNDDVGDDNDNDMLPMPLEPEASANAGGGEEDDAPAASAAVSTVEDTGAAPIVDPEPRPVPEQMYLPADDEDVSVSATDADEMPIDETADLLPVGDDERPAVAQGQWEYREVVLKNWQQHVDNIEYALEQGGDKITIEDAYTRLLNESGAQGWEVISEELLPQQYIRLLMKRPVR